MMAEDVAHLPATGITPGICGDAHLGNFGFYASPERDLVIDLNEFDEAHPGAWEWDLRRLVASIWVAGRENGSSEAQCRASVASCIAAYRQEVRSRQRTFVVTLLSATRRDRLRETATDKTLRGEITRAIDAVATGAADLVSFGRLFIGNPDLVRRLRENAPFNVPDTRTFYGGGAKGYADYPMLDERETV